MGCGVLHSSTYQECVLERGHAGDHEFRSDDEPAIVVVSSPEAVAPPAPEVEVTPGEEEAIPVEEPEAPAWEPPIDVPVEVPASPEEAPFVARVHGESRPESRDEVGVVVVRVSLRGVSRSGKPAQHQTGNIIKSFSVQEARVSEVYQYLHQACFGRGPSA